jgi:hypothetical protein
VVPARARVDAIDGEEPHELRVVGFRELAVQMPSRQVSRSVWIAPQLIDWIGSQIVVIGRPARVSIAVS